MSIFKIDLVSQLSRHVKNALDLQEMQDMQDLGHMGSRSEKAVISNKP
jgi:hypothetical protein